MPRFDGGLESPKLVNPLAGKYIPGVSAATQYGSMMSDMKLGVELKPELSLGGGIGSLSEKDPSKFFGLDGASGVAKSGGAGTFLKNNAAGIANTAMSALNFANTIGNASKNTMTADEMMGSGG